MQGRLLPFEHVSDTLTARDDCERITLVDFGEMDNPDGTPAAAVYAFVRTVDGQELDVVLAVNDDRMPVTESMLGHICRRLRLDTEDFYR